MRLAHPTLVLVCVHRLAALVEEMLNALREEVKEAQREAVMARLHEELREEQERAEAKRVRDAKRAAKKAEKAGAPAGGRRPEKESPAAAARASHLLGAREGEDGSFEVLPYNAEKEKRAVGMTPEQIEKTRALLSGKPPRGIKICSFSLLCCSFGYCCVWGGGSCALLFHSILVSWAMAPVNGIIICSY